MTLGKRLLYYFGGFGIGMILLLFFLGGKRASCDYLPNARTLKNIREKSRVVSESVLEKLYNNKLDTSAISYLLTHGNVDFKKSNTTLDSCKVYIIEGDFQSYSLLLQVENCEKQARIQNLDLIP